MGVGNSKSKKEECDTKHAKPITEDISETLYNSIVRIELTNSINKSINATGFFMRIKINKNKEIKCLFTCKHVISDNDINNKIVINLYYGKQNKEEERTIKLDKDQRFIKTFDEDVTLIEIIKDDSISEDKYLTPDLNYEYGYNKYINKDYYLPGYPSNYKVRCIASGMLKKYQRMKNMNLNIQYIQKKVLLVRLFVMKNVM